MCNADVTELREEIARLRAKAYLTPQMQDMLAKLIRLDDFANGLVIRKNFLACVALCVTTIWVAGVAFVLVTLHQSIWFRWLRWLPPRSLVWLKSRFFVIVSASEVVAIAVHLLYVWFGKLAPIPAWGSFQYWIMWLFFLYAAVGCLFFAWCASTFVLGPSTKFACFLFLHSVLMFMWFLFMPQAPDLDSIDV